MEVLNEWTPFLVSIGSLLAAWRFGIVYEARERWIFLDTLMLVAFAAALATLIGMDVRQDMIATPGDLLARGIGLAFDAAGVAGVPAALALMKEGYKRQPRQARAPDTEPQGPEEPMSREHAGPDDPLGLDPGRFTGEAGRKRDHTR